VNNIWSRFITHYNSYITVIVWYTERFIQSSTCDWNL